MCDIQLAHLAVIRALEYVGHRILVINNRSIRGDLRGVPPHLTYTVVPVADCDLDRVTAATMWSPLEVGFPTLAARIVAGLDDYVRDLIRARIEHQMEYLIPICETRTATCPGGG